MCSCLVKVELGLPPFSSTLSALSCCSLRRSCWSPVCAPSLQLVSDARRMSDLQWFREAYGAVVQTVRVAASEQSRRQRGWAFTPGELLTAFAPRARNTADHPPADQPPFPTFKVIFSLPGRVCGRARDWRRDPETQECPRLESGVRWGQRPGGGEVPMILGGHSFQGCPLWASGLLEEGRGPTPSPVGADSGPGPAWQLPPVWLTEWGAGARGSGARASASEPRTCSVAIQRRRPGCSCPRPP